MDCSSEESEIRQALESVPGIRSLVFQLGARTLRLDADEAAYAPALEAIRKAGFDPLAVETQTALSGSTSETHGHDHDHDSPGLAGGISRLVLALALATGAEVISFIAPDEMVWKIAGMAVAAIAIWLAGIDTYKKGMAALMRGKLNINALMSVAVTGAFVIGQWPEAAMVMALYAIAELIEAKAVDRARNAIKSLLELAPEEALVLGPDGTWSVHPVTAVELNETVRIKPGERVPLDGVVTKGNGAINQAPVTGESIPVDKAPGDQVFAGTINETGELEVRVTAGASNSTLARIIQAVEQAQGTRAPTQRFVDLHPGDLRHCHRGCPRRALSPGSDLAGSPVQGAGPAGDRVPLRAGHLNAGHGGQRIGGRRPPGHPDQGWHVPGRRKATQGGSAGQDRDHHRRQTQAGRVAHLEWGRRIGRQAHGGKSRRTL